MSGLIRRSEYISFRLEGVEELLLNAIEDRADEFLSCGMNFFSILTGKNGCRDLGLFTRSLNGKNQVGILEKFLFHYFAGWCRLHPPSKKKLPELQ
jgi:hypothetical protein